MKAELRLAPRYAGQPDQLADQAVGYVMTSLLIEQGLEAKDDINVYGQLGDELAYGQQDAVYVIDCPHWADTCYVIYPDGRVLIVSENPGCAYEANI